MNFNGKILAFERLAANVGTQTVTLHNMENILEKLATSMHPIGNRLTALQSHLDQFRDQHGHGKLWICPKPKQPQLLVILQTEARPGEATLRLTHELYVLWTHTVCTLYPPVRQAGL